MKASMLYRIAAVLLVLFEAGHTSGFPWSDPKWGVDIGSMRSTHFYIMGFSRTYWDFYVGFGLFVSVFLLLAVVLAWQLGAFRQSLWRACAARRGRSPFALPPSRF